MRRDKTRIRDFDSRSIGGPVQQPAPNTQSACGNISRFVEIGARMFAAFFHLRNHHFLVCTCIRSGIANAPGAQFASLPSLHAAEIRIPPVPPTYRSMPNETPMRAKKYGWPAIGLLPPANC
jgi:hypothetical protein